MDDDLAKIEDKINNECEDMIKEYSTNRQQIE